MLSKVARTAIFLCALGFAAGTAFGQVGSIRGKVIDKDGEGVKDAMILIERQDIKGDYKVKSKKNGQFFHAGLPIGVYNIALEIKGQVVDRIRGYRVSLGDPEELVFDIGEIERRQQQAAAAAQSGPTEEQLREMSPEERKRYEEALKKQQQQLSKNKELNEAFNNGMQALKSNDFATAVTNLQKAVEIDPEQDVVWANLADAQSNLAKTKAGPERDELMNGALESYQKALALKPTDAAYHNNLGLTLIQMGKMDEGIAELSKAAELDPVNGGKYFFNLGAVMVNTGNADGAVDAFRKATEIDPNYADAYYQLGTALVGKATIKDDGSIEPVPGTVEAFQKYLELKPDGPYAAGAQQMIQSLTGAVDTTYENPDAKKKKS